MLSRVVGASEVYLVSRPRFFSGFMPHFHPHHPELPRDETENDLGIQGLNC